MFIFQDVRMKAVLLAATFLVTFSIKLVCKSLKALSFSIKRDLNLKQICFISYKKWHVEIKLRGRLQTVFYENNTFQVDLMFFENSQKRLPTRKQCED